MVARQRRVRTLVRAALVILVLTVGARPGAAQSLGTFRRQALPFCNVITLAVVQVGSVFTLDGFDDQCGAATRASVVGTAFLNPDGSIGIGLTTIATPGGGPVHMDVMLHLATLGGPWRDSGGNVGTLVFTPGGGTGGPGRPIGRGIGAAAIDPTQVQRRVTGSCTAGSVMRVINDDGTVVCDSGIGDITSVTAGSGLIGGAANGAVEVAVAFAGPGTASTAARSDHRHQDAGENTVLGRQALQFNTSGQYNVAAGWQALFVNATGGRNTAVGAAALADGVDGHSNTAIGAAAGVFTTGFLNTFVGAEARGPNNSSLANATAIGAQARVDSNNTIVLGSIAGVNGAQSNVNVGIGTNGPLFPLHVVSTGGASGRIQVGSVNSWSAGQRRIISFGDGVSVYVGEEDANDRLVLSGSSGVRFKANLGSSVAPDLGNLMLLGSPANRWVAVYAVNGTIQTSDARLKRNIADLDYGLASLLRLRPVSFRWKDDDAGRVNLGLLAQEVEQVIPEAVVHGATPDEPLGMSYSTLIPVLIKAIQQQDAERRRQEARIEELARQVSALQQVARPRP